MLIDAKKLLTHYIPLCNITQHSSLDKKPLTPLAANHLSSSTTKSAKHLKDDTVKIFFMKNFSGQ